jgi:hypothetical protein
MKYVAAAGLTGLLAAGILGYLSLLAWFDAGIRPLPEGCRRSHLELTVSTTFSTNMEGKQGPGLGHLVDLHRFCDQPTDAPDPFAFYPP